MKALIIYYQGDPPSDEVNRVSIELGEFNYGQGLV